MQATPSGAAAGLPVGKTEKAACVSGCALC